jgi:hypothetical protein
MASILEVMASSIWRICSSTLLGLMGANPFISRPRSLAAIWAPSSIMFQKGLSMLLTIKTILYLLAAPKASSRLPHPTVTNKETTKQKTNSFFHIRNPPFKKFMIYFRTERSLLQHLLSRSPKPPGFEEGGNPPQFSSEVLGSNHD